MKINAIMIKPQDNVATALHDLKGKESVAVGVGEIQRQLRVTEDIPYGHKFAVINIEKGDNIIKYGEIIGRATQFIAQGGHAHIHNIEGLRGRGDLE